MTIQKPIIEELRYVNGQPDPSLRPDQTRINWAKNGESILGATGDTTSDGVLNRAPVQIQENILNSHNNTKAQQETIGQLVDTVNELTGGEDADLGSRMTTAEFDINVLETEVNNLQSDVGAASTETALATGIHLTTENIVDDIGVRNPQDIPNDVENNDTVRKDLYFIKRRIGNDRNYDVNGNLVPDTAPTGMKFQIDDLYNKVATVNQEIGENVTPGTINGRLTDLEQNSQAGSVTAIRAELGDSADAVEGRSVYLRLDDIESQNADFVIDIAALDATLVTPVTGLVPRVTALETEVAGAISQADANELSITTISNDVGVYSVGDTYSSTIKERLSSHSTDLTSLWTRVGATDDDIGSIGNRVKELESTVGDVNSPAEFTAWYEIAQNAGDIVQLRADVDAMGPSTLQTRLATLEAAEAAALIASETPDEITIPTTLTNVVDVIDEEVELVGYTFVDGALISNAARTAPLTIAWVMYEPHNHTHLITIRVEITHPDTSVEIHDYTRKLRGNLVTPIAISHTATLVAGSAVKVYVQSDSVGSSVEHDSLFIRI
ncbi:fibritin neck whisker [Vibrio phage D480]|nr:fibritin neck whiskers protein [Vibrio phage 6E35.1a]